MDFVRLGCTTLKVSHIGLGAIRDPVHEFRRVSDQIPRFREPWKSN